MALPALGSESSWYEFVDAKADVSLLCPTCAQPASDPVAHFPTTPGVNCGRVYCRKCKEQCEARGMHCLHCNEPFSEDSIMNAPTNIRDALAQIRVRCITCKTIVSRKDFESHVSSMKCKIVCPHGCKKKISRNEWNEHEQDCPEKLVSCIAGDVGCTFRAPRQDMHKHTCSFQSLRPVLQKNQADFAMYRSQILNNISSIKTLTSDVNTLKKDLGDSNENIAFLVAELQAVKGENQILRAAISSEADRVLAEAKKSIELQRLQRDHERTQFDKELAVVKFHNEKQTEISRTLEREMRDFRLNIITELNRDRLKAQDSTPASSIDFKAITGIVETEWTRKEAAKEPLLAGKPSPTPIEFVGFKELQKLIDEQRSRIDSLEKLIQPVNDSLLSQLGISGADLLGDSSESFEGEMQYVVFEEEEAELDVNDLMETYPDVDTSALEEYLTARKELETLRGKLADKETRLTQEEESELVSEIGLEGEGEVEWAFAELSKLKDEFDSIRTRGPGLDEEGSKLLDDILSGADKPADQAEEAEETEALGALPTPISYVKKRFQLSRSPSNAMLEYLMALPPDSATPEFKPEEVVKIQNAPVARPRLNTIRVLTPGAPTPESIPNPSTSTSGQLVPGGLQDPKVGQVPPKAAILVRTSSGKALVPINPGDGKKEKKKDKDRKKDKSDKSKGALGRLSKAFTIGSGKKDTSTESQYNLATAGTPPSPKRPPNYLDDDLPASSSPATSPTPNYAPTRTSGSKLTQPSASTSVSSTVLPSSLSNPTLKAPIPTQAKSASGSPAVTPRGSASNAPNSSVPSTQRFAPPPRTPSAPLVQPSNQPPLSSQPQVPPQQVLTSAPARPQTPLQDQVAPSNSQPQITSQPPQQTQMQYPPMANTVEQSLMSYMETPLASPFNDATVIDLPPIAMPMQPPLPVQVPLATISSAPSPIMGSSRARTTTPVNSGPSAPAPFSPNPMPIYQSPAPVAPTPFINQNPINTMGIDETPFPSFEGSDFDGNTAMTQTLPPPMPVPFHLTHSDVLDPSIKISPGHSPSATPMILSPRGQPPPPPIGERRQSVLPPPPAALPRTAYLQSAPISSSDPGHLNPAAIERARMVRSSTGNAGTPGAPGAPIPQVAHNRSMSQSVGQGPQAYPYRPPVGMQPPPPPRPSSSPTLTRPGTVDNTPTNPAAPM